MPSDPSQSAADPPPGDGTPTPAEQMLAEFLQAEEAGTAPPREEFLASHPDMAPQFQSFFTNQDQLQKVAGGIFAGPAGGAGPALDISLPGTLQFGDYELLSEVGRGGMGVVFKARHIPLNRIVALKVIVSGQFASPLDVDRFHAEAEHAALLDHPHIVPVYQVGECSGQHYFTMKFIEGGSLAQHPPFACGDGVSCRAAAQFIADIAYAVDHAHQRGVLHRDLKPANILIDSAGQPVVTDFGLSRRTDDIHRTLTGTLLGTPAYMSPEQARGEKVLTTAADVYGLGAILYFLLTGNPPFRGQDIMETLTQVRDAQPTPPRRANPAIPPDLETICLKCLAKTPEQRYPSAAALAEDLRRFLASEPIAARRATLRERFMLWRRRNRTLAASLFMSLIAAVAVISTLTVATILISGERRKVQTQLDAVVQADKNAAEARAQAGAAEQGKKDALTEALDQKARAQQAQQRAEQAQVLAQQSQAQAEAAATQIALERDKTHEALHQALAHLADAMTAKGIDDPASTLNARAALWFANAATADPEDPIRVETNMIRVRNWLRGQWQPVAAFRQKGDEAQFDPENERYLLTWNGFSREVGVALWDVQDEKPLAMPSGFGNLAAAAWARKDHVLLANAAGDVLLASVPDMKPFAHWQAGGKVSAVAVSADGQYVAAAGKTLDVWPTRGGGGTEVELGAEAVYVAFSPTENKCVVVTADNQATLYAVQDSSGTLELKPVGASVKHIYRNQEKDWWKRPPVFVQKGKMLVTVDGNSQRVELKWYDTETGGLLSTSTDAANQAFDMSASPDGSLLVLGSAIGRVYDVATKKVITGLGEVLHIAFSGNGTLMAHSAVGGIHFRAVGSGKVSNSPFPAIERGASVALSYHGDYVALISNGLVEIFRSPKHAEPFMPFHPVEFQGKTTWAAFSPDSRHAMPIGTLDGNYDVRVLERIDAATGKPDGKPIDLEASLASADFSPQGENAVTATGRAKEPKLLRFWNLQTGSLLYPPVTLPAAPVWTTYSPDGGIVAVHLIDGAVLLVDAGTGKISAQFKCAAVRGVDPWMGGRGTISFSHDGRTIYTWGSRVFQAWDRGSCFEKYAFKFEADCCAVAESPDGKTVAIGSHDNSILFVDTTTGKEARSPIFLGNEISTVCFSPDGRFFASSCTDNKVRIWNVETWALVSSISQSYVSGATFTPDSRRLILSSVGRLSLWDPQTGLPLTPVLSDGSLLDFTLPCVSADGKWMVDAGSGSSHRPIIDLQSLSQPGAMAPEDALLYCELAANARVSGTSVVNLSIADLLERWNRYRALHPAEP